MKFDEKLNVINDDMEYEYDVVVDGNDVDEEEDDDDVEEVEVWILFLDDEVVVFSFEIVRVFYVGDKYEVVDEKGLGDCIVEMVGVVVDVVGVCCDD